MPQKSEIETFCPTNKTEWRLWLQENHRSKQAVWLVQHKKNSGKPSLSWGDSVDEALCFGWIDSVRRPLDHESFLQFFGKRKPNGTWSKVNKEKINLLIAAGKMTEAGFESVETAKKNGSWTLLDEVEEGIIPEDLELAFEQRPCSKDYFLGLSRSVRKAILQWLVLAKREETRQKRIEEIAELAGQKQKPKQFR